jgi:hypothetical protein
LATIREEINVEMWDAKQNIRSFTQQEKERAQDMIPYILVSHIWLATKENKWELKK